MNEHCEIPLLHVKNGNGHLVVVNCDPKLTTFDNIGLHRCRSIVMNKHDKQIHCVSPYKSVNYQHYSKRHGDKLNDKDYVCNVAIEGTMINLFFDWKETRWEIATRGAVGGKYWFYRNDYIVPSPSNTVLEKPMQKTFLQMMLDALRIDETPYQPWYCNPLFHDLDTQYSYSFVLQHPENHIVYQYQRPMLYLVAMYHIPKIQQISWNDLAGKTEETSSTNPWVGDGKNDKDYVYYVSSYSEIARNMFLSWIIHGLVYLPEKCSMKEVLGYMDNPGYNRPYPMGWMITHIDSGERCKIENQHYLKLKELRGNNPNLQYHFFALMRIGKSKEFVDTFPQYRPLFSRFFHQYVDFLHQVFGAYKQYYMYKSRATISKHIFIHIAKIHHTYYLSSTSTELHNPRVTYQTIRDYFEKMEPQQLLYIMNHCG